jgi:hypothetical protein
MSTVSTPLFLIGNIDTTPINLNIGVDPALSNAPYLELNGQYTNLFYQNPGEILDPPEDPVLGNKPPLPDYLLVQNWLDSSSWDDSDSWLEQGQNQPFDYLQLPRLQAQPSKVFNLNVYSTRVLINNVDFSNALYSLDWQTPISGVSQGSLLLKETLGLNINPDSNGIAQGSEVEIYVKETPQTEELLTRCYVLGFPSLSLNGEGTYEVQIQLGDELALLSQTTRSRSKYCGQVPKTTQELANIYAQLNGLRTRIFPTGHTINEASVNNFLTESPYEFLQAIYAPINKDVRTTSNGLVIVPTRRKFDLETAYTLSYKDVIQSQNNFSKFYETYTTVKASNDFSLELDFAFSSRTYTQVNGNPENTKPWFQGGYQEIRTTITSLGDTNVYTLKETFAYVPLESLPWPKELVDLDPCAIGEFTTVFDVIEREIISLTYYSHPSGTKIVTKEEKWVNGLKITQIKDELDPNFEDYDLYNGSLSYDITTYQNSPQANVSVCEKDYQLLSTYIRNEKYGLDKDFNFLFQSWSSETYSPSGVSSSLGQQSFTGTELRWNKTLITGEFSQDENIWIIQPAINTPNENPPQAQVIKPIVESVTNFSQFTLIPGASIEPKPLSAPFCYDKNQLDTYAERYLREQFGLSKSIVIVTPFREPLGLNDSVVFTDRLGQTYNYICYDVEVNITLQQCTKTYTLLRWYE